jgi:hypothetical protein
MVALVSAPPSAEEGLAASASVPAWDDDDYPTHTEVPPDAYTATDGSVRLDASPFPPLPQKRRLVGPSVDAYPSNTDSHPHAPGPGVYRHPEALHPSAPPLEPVPSMAPSAPPMEDDGPLAPSAPPLEDDDDGDGGHFASPSAPSFALPDALPRYERS